MGIIRTKPVDQDRDRPTWDNSNETSRPRPRQTDDRPRERTDDDSMSALITSNIFDDGFFAFPHELAFFEPPCGTAKQVCKRQRQWPRMDIVEHDKAYLVTADTPGVPKDQPKVELTKDGITLSFDHDEAKEEKAEDGKIIRRERSHRSFRRTIGLPADGIDRNGIAAKVEDGVLRLTIPKAPESVPKTISIE